MNMTIQATTQRTDHLHSFRTPAGSKVQCRVRIYETRWNTVVLVTELGESIYSSITLYAEDIATEIVRQHKLDPKRLIWIEHLPLRDERGDYEELYDLVHFETDGNFLFQPHWTPLHPSEVEVLTGDGVVQRA